jgi:hypothetical protein
VEEVLAEVALELRPKLPLRPEVSSGDEIIGFDEESCAEAAKGRDEGDF